MPEKTRPAPYWGTQAPIRWLPGESDSRGLATLELVNALRDHATAPSEGAKAVGLWRVSVIAWRGDVPALLSIAYGAGGDSVQVDRLLTPLVAYVPGFASVRAVPFAPVVGLPLELSVSVVPVMAVGSDASVRSLVDATVAPVVMPFATWRFTAWAAATYTPTGAPAPIPVAAGATVDVAGRTVLNTGAGVAWLTL